MNYSSEAGTEGLWSAVSLFNATPTQVTSTNHIPKKTLQTVLHNDAVYDHTQPQRKQHFKKIKNHLKFSILTWCLPKLLETSIGDKMIF